MKLKLTEEQRKQVLSAYENKELIELEVFEPKQKIIDLSMMVGSDIDMEFKGATFWWVDKLKAMKEGRDKYIGGNTTTLSAGFSTCRIRESHWHHWNGDECPLPEGFEIEIEYYDRDDGELIREGLNNYRNMDWSNIAGFKVLGTADDACYEWQKEKEE